MTPTPSHAQTEARILAAVLQSAHPKLALPTIAANNHLTLAELQTMLTRCGYPDKDRLQKAWNRAVAITRGETPPDDEPEIPPTETPSVSRQSIIDAGLRHPAKRIQAAAKKAIADLDRLRAMLAEDQEKNAARREAEEAKAKAREEVARLEKQLRAAKAKLRRTPPAPVVEGDHPCPHDDCSRSFPTAQGRTLHVTRTHTTEGGAA